MKQPVRHAPRFARPCTGAALVLALVLSPPLAACGGGGSAPDAASQTALVAPGTWAVLGSSTAAGQSVAAGESWVDRLRAATSARGVQISKLVRSGLLTTQALPVGTPVPAGSPAPDPSVNLDRALSLAPNLVLVAFPSNDVVAGVSPAQTVDHWKLMRQRAAAAGAATMVLSSQPRDGLDVAQRAALDTSDRLAAAAFGPCFVPVYALLADGQGRISAAYSAGDGVHLNAEGQRLVYEQVRAVLDSGRCVRIGP